MQVINSNIPKTKRKHSQPIIAKFPFINILTSNQYKLYFHKNFLTSKQTDSSTFPHFNIENNKINDSVIELLWIFEISGFKKAFKATPTKPFPFTSAVNIPKLIHQIITNWASAFYYTQTQHSNHSARGEEK